MKFQPLALHPVALQHAPLLHELYLRTPDYFSLLGTRPPSLGEVERDVQTALFDPRRCLELIYQGAGLPGGGLPGGGLPGGGLPGGPAPGEPVGSLDYKLNFPEPGDVTINLLLIRGDLQSSGLGQQVVRLLEARLQATRTSAPPDHEPQTPNVQTSDVQTSDSQIQHAQSPDLEPPRLQTGHATPRLLASVLGENPRAVAFWQRLGFSFATDARPVMTWYAKPLGSPAPARLAATS